MEASSEGRSYSAPFLCGDTSGAACGDCRDRIILTSLLFNIVSVVVNGVFGVMCGSQSILAQAVHSFADTVGAGFVYFAARGSSTESAPPPRPGVRIAGVLFLSGIWICGASVTKLVVGGGHPGLFALVVAAVSVLVNWRLYSVSACASKRLDDPGINLCRIQNRTSLFTACVAFVGVLLAELGFLSFDPLSAILIGAVVLAAGVEILVKTPPGQPASAQSTTLFTIAALSLSIVAFFVYDAIRRTDVLLIPSQGPTISSPVENVLGRARYFLVVDTSKHTVKPILNGARTSKDDVSGNLVAVVEAHDVDIVLAQKIGAEVYTDLRKEKVRMYYVKQPGTVREAVQDFEGRRLDAAEGPNVGRGFGRAKVQWLSPW